MANNPNFDDKINSFNQEQEKEQVKKEEASTVKPKISKKTASLVIQYGMIAITVGGIFYKMFIQDTSGKAKVQPIQYVKKETNENKDSDFGSTEIQQVKKATIADKKDIGVDIGYKSRSIVSVDVPALTLPKVPQIEIKEESKVDDIKKSIIQESKETPKMIMPSASPLEIAANLESKVNNEKNPKNNQSNLNNPSSQNQSNPGPVNQNQTNQNIKKEYETIQAQANVNSAMGDMFLVKGSGGSNKNYNNSGNNNSNGKDIIILNGSRFVEVESDVKDNAQVQKIRNLSNTILTGKILEAVLETAINTQMPGTVRAVVSRDIYSETGTNVIIPAGSRLYGTYTTTNTPGDSRVGIMWNRIIRPDAISISISAQAVDESGQAGVPGDVDYGYATMFKNSMLLSFISLGTAIAAQKLFNLTGQTQIVNNNGSTATTNVTPANAAVQNVVNLSNTIAKNLSQNLSQQIKSTITIDQGTIVGATINADLTAPAYVKIAL